MNLNRATIIGNVTRDPELRTTPSGANVATFAVATNQKWTDSSGQKQERTEFHNIVSWGKLAEVCSQYVKKGAKIYAEGRLQTREWQAQDGAKRSRTEIILEHMILLDRPNQQPAAKYPEPAPEPQPSGISDGSGEDIPF